MKKTNLREIGRGLFRQALPILITALVVLVVSGVRVLAQGNNVQAQIEPSAFSFSSGTTQNPWFWITIGGWLFSALVSGMPEPEKDYSPFYIWMYRSFHIIAASGTSYFQHKSMWPVPESVSAVTESTKTQTTHVVQVSADPKV